MRNVTRCLVQALVEAIGASELFVPVRACALVASMSVSTAHVSAIVSSFTFINILFTVCIAEILRTLTLVAVYFINTSSMVLTRVGGAFIKVRFTVYSCITCYAVTLVTALSVFTRCAVLT